MPSYFDPIAYDHVEINPNTIIYLVKNGNKFAIKAMETGLEQLTREPTTRATEYWRIDTVKLLNEQALNPIIFPENQLTNESLTLNKVTEYLGIDPTTLVPTRFQTRPSVTITNHDFIEAVEYEAYDETDADDDEIENDEPLVGLSEVITPPYLRDPTAFFNSQIPIVASYDSMSPRNFGFNNTDTESTLNTQEQPIIGAYRRLWTSFNHRENFFHHAASTTTLYRPQPTNTLRPLTTITREIYTQMFDLALNHHLSVDLLFRQQEDTDEILPQTFGFAH